MRAFSAPQSRAFSAPDRGPVTGGAADALPGTGGRGWMLCAGLGSLVYMNARFVLTADTDPDLGAVDPTSTISQLILLSIGLFHAWRYPAVTVRILLRGWPFLLAAALAGASFLWSQAPSTTLRRTVSLCTLLLFVPAMWNRLGIERFMRVLVWTTVLAAFVSLAVAAVRPDIGFDVGVYANAIRGIFWQKNGLGVAILGGVVAHCFLVLERGRLSLWDAGLAFFFLVMLVASRSTTALLLSVAVIGATPIALGLFRGGAWTLTTVVLTLAGITFALLIATILGSSGLFEAVGKDDSLTGRTNIWAEVYEAIARRRLLGYGYNAFWMVGAPAAELIWQHLSWAAPAAHSGYLDTVLQLGLVGLLMVAVMNIVTVWRALVAIVDGRGRRAFWALTVIVVYGIYNYSESMLLRPDLQLFFWVMAALSVVREYRPEELRVSAGPWSFHNGLKA